MYKAYNDYELLYLANDYDDMVALGILVRKYKNFIYKKAISFFPNDNNLEDYYQEGLLCLLRSIKTFNDKYNKTFMRYFEVILNRSFINIYNRNKRDKEKVILLINEHIVEKSPSPEYEEVEYVKPVINLKSPIERLVYKLYFQEGKSVEEVAKRLKKTRKQIYNSIYRVKQKVTEKMKND